MKKKIGFSIYVLMVLLGALGMHQYLRSTATKDILPIIMSIRHHESPMRTPGTFREDFSDSSSLSELIFYGDTAFAFKYKKSTRQKHPFAGAWFPLENVDIDFSRYDLLLLDLRTKHSRRIPFNLSVQNKKETHQYVRNFIDVVKGQRKYVLRIDEFHTPIEWYETNNISQAEIPAIDLSLVEALSVESCHLIKPGQEDKIIINQMLLKKELGLTYFFLIFGTIATLFLGWLVILRPYSAKSEIVHVPIKMVETKEQEPLEKQIVQFLGANYTNPNLTLDDLKDQFYKSKGELSRMIREETKMTFPKYLNYLRIQEAKRLLKAGKYKTVAEVGYEVGFNSPSNFIRVFKGTVGISPKKFTEDQ